MKSKPQQPVGCEDFDKTRNAASRFFCELFNLQKYYKFVKKHYICPMSGFKKYIFNSETLSYEVDAGYSGRRALRVVSLVVLSSLTAVLNLWLLTDVLGLELPKTTWLKKKNAALLSQVELLGTSIREYDERLTALQMRDNDIYRTVLGLGDISAEVRNAGFSGANRYLWLEGSDYNVGFRNAVIRTDMLLKKAYIQSKSYDEVERLARQAGNMASCVPIIPPINPDRSKYHLSSRFGGRIDPKYNRPAFHHGLDFAARVGYPVYATGDGTVEMVSFSARGYGNQIIIDHGFGYKTRYAHLSFVNVAEGMKIKRGENIGNVGNSGKSTGPHLHYEVIYKGRPTNPANYMDLEMTVEEYASMAQVSESAAQRVVVHPSHRRTRR